MRARLTFVVVLSSIASAGCSRPGSGGGTRATVHVVTQTGIPAVGALVFVHAGDGTLLETGETEEGDATVAVEGGEMVTAFYAFTTDIGLDLVSVYTIAGVQPDDELYFPVESFDSTGPDRGDVTLRLSGTSVAGADGYGYALAGCPGGIRTTPDPAGFEDMTVTPDCVGDAFEPYAIAGLQGPPLAFELLPSTPLATLLADGATFSGAWRTDFDTIGYSLTNLPANAYSFTLTHRLYDSDSRRLVSNGAAALLLGMTSTSGELVTIPFATTAFAFDETVANSTAGTISLQRSGAAGDVSLDFATMPAYLGGAAVSATAGRWKSRGPGAPRTPTSSSSARTTRSSRTAMWAGDSGSPEISRDRSAFRNGRPRSTAMLRRSLRISSISAPSDSPTASGPDGTRRARTIHGTTCVLPIVESSNAGSTESAAGEDLESRTNDARVGGSLRASRRAAPANQLGVARARGILNSMGTIPVEPGPATGAEKRFVLHGVPWWTYVALRDALDDSGLKMTYLEGTLELMSPSTLHEDAKKMIARLIEVWAMEKDLDLRGFGGATFRREAKERGLEPDECYKLGELGEDGVPDIAIEVIVSSGLVDKMAVYAGLGVPEVWEWRPGANVIVVHRLSAGRYERDERSAVLPEVDLAVLSRFVRPGENQTRLAKEYQAELRSH